MKHSKLLTLALLPIVAACGPVVSGDNDFDDDTNSIFKAGENVQTRNYKNIDANELHPKTDDGYVSISSVLINSEHFVDVDEETTYIYKLACKDSTDSFQTHKFTCDDDGYYYAEISSNQHNLIPNGFSILKTNNLSGSAVEIEIKEIYECHSYTELFYSEAEQKIKVVDFNHVIPGLDETEVNSLVGKAIDYYVYVDETEIKSMNHGVLPFDSELTIKYIDVSGADIKIG